MNNRRYSKLDNDELIGIYAKAAAQHGYWTISGNSRETNRQFEIVAGVYRELRSRGSEAQRALLRLLSHDDIAVRGWAAAHALEFAPEDRQLVLEEIARTPGILGFEAQMVLQEWRAGRLKFP